MIEILGKHPLRFPDMTVTIIIPCQPDDNTEVIANVVKHLGAYRFQINVDDVGNNPKSKVASGVPRAIKAPANTKKPITQGLGEIKRRVLLAHAAHPNQYFGRDAVAFSSDLTPEQVRSAVTDGLDRGELVPESSAKGARTKITEHGLERLKHDEERRKAERPVA